MFHSPRALVIILFSSYAVGVAGKCSRAKTCSTREAFDVSKDLEKYYSGTTGLQGQRLKTKLNSIIKGHKNYSYDCVWAALADVDADPNDSSKVIAFYSRRGVDILDRAGCTGSGSQSWNREHVWAKSHGFKKQSQHAHTDFHHLFPSSVSINSDRSDRDFKEIAEKDRIPVTTSECDGCFKEGTNPKNGFFEPPDAVKGQVARVMFYMATRYEGGDRSTTDDLVLVDRKTDFPDNEFGVLSDLLRWHCEHPVEKRERDRNDNVQEWQGNRNPFIDRPEFVQTIWGDEFPEAFVNCDSNPDETDIETNPDETNPDETNPDETNTDETSTDEINPDETNSEQVWINEFHYDNRRQDNNEFVEIGCNQKIDVTGYEIVRYNGNGGTTYGRPDILSGMCSPDKFIYQEYPPNSLQNGGSDGIALINSIEEVIEFISYEGTFTARNGPANGETSVDIGVSESERTSASFSLQLVGEGCDRSDFTWQKPARSSKGDVNMGQTIVCGLSRTSNDEL